MKNSDFPSKLNIGAAFGCSSLPQNRWKKKPGLLIFSPSGDLLFLHLCLGSEFYRLSMLPCAYFDLLNFFTGICSSLPDFVENRNKYVTPFQNCHFELLPTFVPKETFCTYISIYFTHCCTSSYYLQYSLSDFMNAKTLLRLSFFVAFELNNSYGFGFLFRAFEEFLSFFATSLVSNW